MSQVAAVKVDEQTGSGGVWGWIIFAILLVCVIAAVVVLRRRRSSHGSFNVRFV